MPKTEIVNPIVSEHFVLVGKDGVARDLFAEVGIPYVVDERESRCPARIRGLDPQYPDIPGAGCLQALSLALTQIFLRLGHVIQRGDQLTLKGDDEAFDLERLGVLFGRSEPPTDG